MERFRTPHRPRSGTASGARRSASASRCLSTLAGLGLLMVLAGCATPATRPVPTPPPKPSTGVEAKVNRGCAEYERLHLAITIAEHFAVSAEHRAIVDKAKAVADAACEGDAATVKQRVARAIVELGTILEQGK